jgi:hypothetical protein
MRLPAPSPATHAPLSATAAAAQFAGRDADGFTGGDGVYSVPLPDGRTAWFFGDSFVGGVQPDGSRSSDPRTFVRNQLVVTGAGTPHTVAGGVGLDNDDLVRPAGARANKDGRGADPWYWPADGVARGTRLQLLVAKMTPGVADPWWGWKQVATDVVTIDTTDMSVQSIAPTGSGAAVAWGAAILDTPEWTYVYGAEADGLAKYVHVARAPGGDLSKPWSYWTGSGWSDDHAASVRLPVEVSSQFSVLQGREGVRLITQRGFDGALHESTAPTPVGPFTDAGVIARIPAEHEGSFAYNALVHEHLSRPGKLLVSWNLSSPYFMANDTVYRPRFMELDEAK